MVHIYVLQKHASDIEGIKGLVRFRNEVLEILPYNHIVYGTSPEEFEQYIASGKPLDMLFTGNVFASAPDFFPLGFGAISKAMTQNASTVARRVKEANPNSVTVLYSALPDSTLFIDAVVEKTSGSLWNPSVHMPLAQLISSPNLDSYIANRDLPGISREFPYFRLL